MTKKKATTQNTKARTPKAKSVLKPVAPVPGAPARPQSAGGTKRDTVLTLLQRDGGASLEELMTATGWLRGFISGTVRKALGMVVVVVKRGDGASAYQTAR